MRGARKRVIVRGRAVVSVALVCAAVLVFAGPAGPATQWSVVPSQTPSGGRLGAVSCANAQMCFATGSISNGQHFSTLMERWDGKRWAMVESPTFGADSGLAGVSCATVRFCIAVGETT